MSLETIVRYIRVKDKVVTLVPWGIGHFGLLEIARLGRLV